MAHVMTPLETLQERLNGVQPYYKDGLWWNVGPISDTLRANIEEAISLLEGVNTMGILEEMRDLLQQIADNTSGGTTSGSSTTSKADNKPVQSAPKKVTHDMLTELVQPLVQQDETKAQVKAVLTKFGLKRLGDAKEEQYKELFEAFSAIGGEAGSEEDDGLL